MKLQLWRNATLLLNINETSILVDPMLGEKGALGPFPMTDNELPNPLVDLPFSQEELTRKLQSIDAVVVTHLHPDHWDSKAVELIDKSVPVLCPDIIADQITQQGFRNTMPVNTSVHWNNIEIFKTKGQHGTGEIGEKMGKVNGFVFKTETNTIYIVGDSIWNKDIADEIKKYKPNHIIVAGGAATFSVGDPIIMTAEDIIEVCKYSPDATIWVTHLEAVSHCKEDRHYIQKKINEKGFEKRCFILKDGEEVILS